MILDEAIIHAEELADYDCYNEKQLKCAEEYRQLAEWLKELKQLREQPRWIPIVKREPTEEEKADHLKYYGEELCFMVESEMPVNGQEVLVSMGDCVSEDIFDEDFLNFENKELEDVDAWMPLPKPYKAESERT